MFPIPRSRMWGTLILAMPSSNSVALRKKLSGLLEWRKKSDIALKNGSWQVRSIYASHPGPLSQLMKKIFLTVVCLTSCFCFGQVSDSLRIAFINKTIDTFFSDSILIKINKNYPYFVIATDLDTSKFIHQVEKKGVTYITRDYLKHKKLFQAQGKNERLIYELSYLTNNSDTVDVILRQISVSINKKLISFGEYCSGGFGYVPEGRGVYNATAKKWVFLTWRQNLETKRVEH